MPCIIKFRFFKFFVDKIFFSFQAPRAEVVLVLSRSRSVTPADRSYDLIDAATATYNFINSSRPPKILESPLDSKSLSAGKIFFSLMGTLHSGPERVYKKINSSDM